MSGLLIAAQVAYLATLVLLGIALINSASVFTLAANIPLMVLVLVSAALAVTLLALALSEIDKCKGGSCDTELDKFRSTIDALMKSLIVFTACLLAFVIFAAIPVLASAGLLILLLNGASITSAISLVVEASLSQTIAAYNACQVKNQASSNSNNTTAVVVLAYFIILVGLVVLGLGYGLGKIPHSWSSNW